MILKDLIIFLEQRDPDLIVPVGFAKPHSYRGYYEELAFEPAVNVTVESMLACAKDAVGRIFIGYKGGEYTMTEYTDVWLANWGQRGRALARSCWDIWWGKSND